MKKGRNHVKIIIKNNLNNLESMFKDCLTLKNIDELKYLNTKYCTNFSYMFYKCKNISNFISLENLGCIKWL